jgi:hypothetical protein
MSNIFKSDLIKVFNENRDFLFCFHFHFSVLFNFHFRFVKVTFGSLIATLAVHYLYIMYHSLRL